MIRIDVAPPAEDRRWKRWRRDCERTTQAMLRAVDLGEKPCFQQTLYRRASIKELFFFGSNAPFRGKCAYCERRIEHPREGDIEHFRPKGGVTDEKDRPIPARGVGGEPIVGPSGELAPHRGYYWLAYDWRNLLPACTLCNQPGTVGSVKIGKHSRFPVTGVHAQRPGEESAEHPLLINPASGDPADDPS